MVKTPRTRFKPVGIYQSIIMETGSENDDQIMGPKAGSMSEGNQDQVSGIGSIGNSTENESSDKSKIGETTNHVDSDASSKKTQNSTRQRLHNLVRATDDLLDKHAKDASNLEYCKQGPSAGAGSVNSESQDGIPRKLPVRGLRDKCRGSSWILSGPQAGLQEPLYPTPANGFLRFSAPTLPLGLF